MTVQYNEAENTIEIKDDVKTQLLAQKIVLGLNIFTAILNTFSKKIDDYGWMEYAWAAIGLFSLAVLIYNRFKISSAGRIHIGEINRIEEKWVLRKKILVLKLKNGKNRNISNFKNQVELATIRELFSQIGPGQLK